MITETAIGETDQLIKKSRAAFDVFRKTSLPERAHLLRCLAGEIESTGEVLIKTAMRETNLPDGRLRGELTRTIFQLNSYADACARGEWLGVSIDHANPERAQPKPDTRKMLVAIGPVVVFGASNFPFAFSTAGGDTATALAAGCSVIVKAHPAHPETGELAAAAIFRALSVCGLPEACFTHIHGASFEIGRQLVMHPLVKAVAFTGSFFGGKALFDWAGQRKDPIPVFAEMGSINPVFLLPNKLKESAAALAAQIAASATLSAGQFCTNPGLVIGIESPELDVFTKTLSEAVNALSPSPMLHAGMARGYREKRSLALSQQQVETVAAPATAPKEGEGLPTIASASGDAFLNNPVLHQEVFGPFSLIVRCRDAAQMLEVAGRLEGQLTCTLMVTEQDIREMPELMQAVQDICGRIIVNGVPTGVEVCLSMQHGGPFPATTDSRFTSVGADGIKRFARPLCFQNWPDALLPAELQRANPLAIWRTINNTLTKEPG